MEHAVDVDRHYSSEMISLLLGLDVMQRHTQTPVLTE